MSSVSDGQYFAEQVEADEPTPSTTELWNRLKATKDDERGIYAWIGGKSWAEEHDHALDSLRTHMEQLEQDRDEQLRRLDNVSALCVQLEQERDNAQQQANAWHDAATSARQFASRLDVEHLEAKVEQLEQERDEFERKLYELESEQS
jgi:chromosome segregation ATPase